MNIAKTDCEKLMNSVLPFAKKMLGQQGGFYPYGGAMRADGQIVAIGGDNGKEKPEPKDLIRLLKGAFVAAAKKGEFRATALVYNIDIALPPKGEKSDAIAVSLNHRDGYSVIVYFPYKNEGGKLSVGAPIAQKGEGDIFPPPGAQNPQ